MQQRKSLSLAKSPVASSGTWSVEQTGFALVLAVHAGLLSLAYMHLSSSALPDVQLMSVRMISPAPVAPSVQPKPKPTPPKPVSVHKPQPPVTRVRTVAPAEQSAIEPVKRLPPEPVKAVEPAPAAVVVASEPAAVDVAEATLPPRFDADYLSNPSPRYPPLSRKLAETGRVLLRVQVSPKGEALTVQLQRSSGFERLDKSALEAVADWRFVPARQEQQTVMAWVIVPIVFSLTR